MRSWQYFESILFWITHPNNTSFDNQLLSSCSNLRSVRPDLYFVYFQSLYPIPYWSLLVLLLQECLKPKTTNVIKGKRRHCLLMFESPNFIIFKQYNVKTSNLQTLVKVTLFSFTVVPIQRRCLRFLLDKRTKKVKDLQWTYGTGHLGRRQKFRSSCHGRFEKETLETKD